MLKLVRLGPTEAPRIVLLNALGSTSGMWRSLVAAMRTTYEIVLLEYPGFGGCEPMRFSSVEELARMAADALRELPPKRHHIIGFSFGSWVGQQLALDTQRDVRSLVLLGSAAHIYQQGVEMIGGWLEMMDRMGLEAALKQLAFWSFRPATFELQPGITTGYVKSCLAGSTDPEMYRQQFAASVRFRHGVALEEIGAPTLILRGQDDIFYPNFCSTELATRIRGSHYLEIPEAGHAMLFENGPAVTGAIQAFLSEVAE